MSNLNNDLNEYKETLKGLIEVEQIYTAKCTMMTGVNYTDFMSELDAQMNYCADVISNLEKDIKEEEIKATEQKIKELQGKLATLKGEPTLSVVREEEETQEAHSTETALKEESKFKTFEKNCFYTYTFAGDSGSVCTLKIVKRTEKSVWFSDVFDGIPEDVVTMKKIHQDIYGEGEFIYPTGIYSMSPICMATKKVIGL